MKWTRALALTGLAAVLATALAAVSCTSTATNPATPAAMTHEQMVERGRYLVGIMGCGDCHTPGALYGAPDTTRTLAGSELGWTGPWGTSYARNLTPDVETGIGSWTEDQIVHTLRTGVRPDGSPLLPPMPWPNLAGMTDEDIASVAAYLKSLPAVTHQNAAALPPGVKGKLPAAVIPPPSEWDGMHLPPPGGPAH